MSCITGQALILYRVFVGEENWEDEENDLQMCFRGNINCLPNRDSSRLRRRCRPDLGFSQVVSTSPQRRETISCTQFLISHLDIRILERLAGIASIGVRETCLSTQFRRRELPLGVASLHLDAFESVRAYLRFAAFPAGYGTRTSRDGAVKKAVVEGCEEGERGGGVDGSSLVYSGTRDYRRPHEIGVV